MGNQRLEFRPAAPDDCSRLRALFSKLWSWDCDEACWRHRFFENPAGPAIAYVAASKDSGDIVGSLALLPLRYRLCGQDVTAELIVDVGVLPEHRKGGTLWRLYKQVEVESYRRNIAFAQAVGSHQAETVGVKTMRLSPLCPLPVFSCSVSLRPVLPERARRWVPRGLPDRIIGRIRAERCQRNALRLAERHGFFLSRVEFPDERLDALWENVKDQWRVALVRDRAFLTWRFAKHPERSYQIWSAQQRSGNLLGYCVTSVLSRHGVSRGRLVDLLTDRGCPEVAQALTLHGVGSLLKRGSDLLVGWFLPQGWWDQFLPRAGLRFRPQVNRHVIVRRVCAENAEDVLLYSGNWFYTGADTDQL